MRKRIKSFEFVREGVRQSLSEDDYFTREEFLKDRREFIKSGVKIEDTWTSEAFVPYERR
jgi:hypothetical protein